MSTLNNTQVRIMIKASNGNIWNAKRRFR